MPRRWVRVRRRGAARGAVGGSRTMVPMPSPATERQQAARRAHPFPDSGACASRCPGSGIPHCNAWVVDAVGGEGHVLFDCGLSTERSLEQLTDALHQIGKRPRTPPSWSARTRTSITTAWRRPSSTRPAASSGCTPTTSTSRRRWKTRSGCWSSASPSDARVACPEELLQHYREAGVAPQDGVSGLVEPDRDLVEGVEVETAVGTWRTVETPGHAPSHVSLYQPERRLLIAGDHILGRVALYYDYGWTDDPVAEYLASLDKLDALDARLCLPGHGKSFTDVKGHVEAHREAALGRLDRVEDVVRAKGPATAIEMIPEIYGRPLSAENAGWLISETMCYLRHLERQGVRRAQRRAGAAALDRDGAPPRSVPDRPPQPGTGAVPHVPATRDEVEVVRSARARRVSVRVDRTTGAVRVTLPQRATLAEVERALTRHRRWLAARLARSPPCRRSSQRAGTGSPCSGKTSSWFANRGARGPTARATRCTCCWRRRSGAGAVAPGTCT